ncbi:MAG: hypothetical protein ACOC5D_05370 [Thermoplasmatota archaeon]
MSDVTTVRVKKDTLKKLQEEKEYPRQTYDELIRSMIKVYEDAKKRNQYDEFLHKIQQPKMKELWDNPDDEAWEDA